MLIPFVGDAYKVRSPVLDSQTCINLYPVLDRDGGKAPAALYRTPGLKLFADDTTHKSVRGLHELNGVLYAVMDSILYQVDNNGDKISLGNIRTGIGRVSILDNGLQLLIAQGSVADIYTLSTGKITPLNSASFYGVVFPGYQDGYGIFPKPNSTTWYITDLFDFSTINALDFAAANQESDNVVAAISSHQEAWLISNLHSEVWYDTGIATFPFERRQTLLVEAGCAAPFTIVKLDNGRLFWLAKNKESKAIVIGIEGYVPKLISTEAITFAIQGYATIDDAFAFAYEIDGHLFYVLTFPTADRTWVYDVATEMWHERRSQINNTPPSSFPNRQGRWRPNCYALLNGKHIVGDFESGKLYQIDNNTYDENGAPITWERTTSHASNDERYISCTDYQIIAQVGEGLSSGTGNDPQALMQVSKNQGRTFGAEMWRSLGKQGDFEARVMWRALGTSRDFVWRVRGSDPIPIAFIGGRANLEISQ
jgi:hypothetical protein